MKFQRQRLLLIVSLAMLAPLGACSSIRGVLGTLGELNRLQQLLRQQTGQNNVQVNLSNNQYLDISFVNSPWAKLPADQKKAKSLDVARLAYNEYRERSELVSVRVTFETEYDLGGLHYSNGMDSTEFGPSELTPDNIHSSGPPLQPPK